MLNQVLLWVIFNIFVLILLILDLGVFHKKDHDISIKESLVWSIIWVLVALLFNLGIYFHYGLNTAIEFFTCYLVERSLSIDNLFVFLLIFSYFQVPSAYQYKVLFWGIIGALIMRIVFIVAGIALVQKFHWLLYLFGIFLIITGIQLFFKKDKEIQPEKNPVLKLFSRFFPITKDYIGGKFAVRIDGRLMFTPLFLVLLVIETTDVVFATDSIPAIFGISLNTFIVYTSNVFAILGLRALYFALAGIMQLFQYLNYGLALILVFIGLKMLLENVYPIPIGAALGIVAGILLGSILLSVLKSPNKKTEVK